MSTLANKVELVAGASKGIAAGIAELALAGATVIVNYSMSRRDAEKVVTEMPASTAFIPWRKRQGRNFIVSST